MTKEIYNFEDLTEKLEALEILKSMEQTSGTQLITYYVPEYSESKVSKLKDQLSQARSIKSKKTQKIVSMGLETLLDVLERKGKFEKGAFVIFVKEKFHLFMRLPKEIATSGYYCSKNFITTNLENYSEICWGLLVIDNSEVTIGMLKNYNIEVLSNFTACIPGKTRAGGQSQPRYDQTRKNLILSHIKKTSEIVNSLFPPNSIEKLCLGGIIPTNESFFLNNDLRPDLKKILEPPLSVKYTNYFGLEELLNKKKEEYEKDIEIYYEDEKLYFSIAGNEKLFFMRELPSEYHIKNIYTSETYLPPYCNTCNRIPDYNCGHELTPVTDLCEPIKFKTKKWRDKFQKYFGTLYQVVHK